MFIKPALVLQLICIGTLISFCRGATKCSTALDVVFVIDASSNVGQENFNTKLTWAADLTDQFELAQNGSAPGSTPAGARFGALVYSRSVAPVFDLWTLDNPAALREALQAAPYLAESTRTSTALQAARGMFSESKGGRQGVPDVLILVSDGSSTSIREAVMQAWHTMRAGITIMAVDLRQDASLWSLRRLTQSEENVFTLKKDSLNELTSKLTQKLCTGLPSTTA